MNVKVKYISDKMNNNFLKINHLAKENMSKIEESLNDEIEPDPST